MGHTFSIYDLHHIDDLIIELGKPIIKKRLSPSKILYVWRHYTAIICHHNGKVLKLEDRSITQMKTDVIMTEVA